MSQHNYTPEQKRKLLAEILRHEAQRAAACLETEAVPGLCLSQQSSEIEINELEQHRLKFPALTHKSYFNYGAQGVMPQRALEAIFQSYEYIQRWGPFSAEANNWMMQEAEQTRACFAAELCVPAETISLTENTSVGCNIVLWGLEWQAGDHLLLSDGENPGIVAIVRELQRRFKIEVSICPLVETTNDADPVTVIARHLRPNTRLLVLSHILWNTGQVLPLWEIINLCRNQSGPGLPPCVLVDAAQAVGVLPLNLLELGIDFYAFTGQKWWCGPEGIGGLYVRPEALEHLRATFLGWRSLSRGDELPFDNRHGDGRQFEIASSAFPLHAGLRTALAVHHEWGTQQRRYQRIKEMSRYLWQRLIELRDLETPPGIICLRHEPPEAGIICFQIASAALQDLVNFLETRNVLVRTMHDPDCVRVCVHYLTTQAEIDLLVEGIKEFCNRQINALSQ